MTEYKIGNAIVRMHGTPDREKVEAATLKFLNKIERQKRQKAKQKGGKAHAP